jgi:thiamine biosynthesis lipoprotein
MLLLACLPLPACSPGPATEEPGSDARRVFRARQPLMGTFFDIQVVGEDEDRARSAIAEAFAEIARVEELLSEWRESSQISEVNRNAGRGPVVVGPELYTVIERSIRISELTGGAFDVTFAACGGLWSFREGRVPAAEQIEACLDHVGYGRLRLDPGASSIELPAEGMRIGIGGIGKGFGVDRAAELLESHGFSDYIVDGGGDVRLSGATVGRPWRVGIAHPRRRGELYGRIEANRGAVVTSGDYERYFERDGRLYHHILDPATGRPATRSVAVTVMAPTALEADALATGLFVLGPDEGTALVERLDGVEALFFAPGLAVRRSSGFPEVEVEVDVRAGTPAGQHAIMSVAALPHRD